MEVLEENILVGNFPPGLEFSEQFYLTGLQRASRFVSQKGGTYEDAKDVLHDALIILHTRSTMMRQGVDDEQQYLMGIVKNLWYKKVKENLSSVSLKSRDLDEECPTTTPHEQKLLLLLEQAGKKCLDLLTAVYFSGNGIETIKKRFGFTSAHSASVQKYKCIEKLKTTIKEKSLEYEDFLV